MHRSTAKIIASASMWFVLACGRDPAFTQVEYDNDATSNGEGDLEEDDKNKNKTAGKQTDFDRLSKDIKKKLKRLPKFGLLVNDPECGFCHVDVLGDQVSTREVPPLWTGSHVNLTGTWYVADAFKADDPVCGDPNGVCLGAKVEVNATGGIKTNYRGKIMPLDVNQDGAPDFPALNFKELAKKTQGQLSAMLPTKQTVNKVHAGNLVLVGTKASPIKIEHDIVVTGDLVIKGYYSGIGTIYTQGNIYIPADLMALKSSFPFGRDEDAALKKAEQIMKSDESIHALGLATARSVFIGDLGKMQTSDPNNVNNTIYNHPAAPANRTAAALGVEAVYNWYTGGMSGYQQLYENAVSCVTGQRTQIGSFNTIEAFLYAQNTVAGIARRASFSIRGGIIADYLHVLSGASRCDGTIASPHGYAGNRSYIEYDYRIATGRLRILEHLGQLFPK